MNQLEKTILDQHARVKDAGDDPLGALEEARGEILAAATPELTLDIMRATSDRLSFEGLSLTRIMREQQDSRSFRNKISSCGRNMRGLAEYGFIQPDQGYAGGLLVDHGEVKIFGVGAAGLHIVEDDPIQVGMGDVFYPPMMWAKALRAEAYRNRPESMADLTIGQYLAEHGLTLGANLTDYGDIVGATGFMPGHKFDGGSGVQEIDDHVRAEEIEAFRLSGLCDQSVVDPNILLNTDNFALDIIGRGGSI